MKYIGFCTHDVLKNAGFIYDDFMDYFDNIWPPPAGQKAHIQKYFGAVYCIKVCQMQHKFLEIKCSWEFKSKIHRIK